MNASGATKFDLIFIDINYEEGDVKVSPPLKFFGTDFLSKLAELTADDAGLIAFNTIVDDNANRKKVVTALKGLPGLKFSSGMQDDLNEVFYVAKGEFDAQAKDKLEEVLMLKIGESHSKVFHWM